jgi:hypothetical protein
VPGPGEVGEGYGCGGQDVPSQEAWHRGMGDLSTGAVSGAVGVSGAGSG